MVLSLRHCCKRFPVFSLLCPGYAQSFPILSISEDRPGRAADKPTGLQTCSSRSLAQTISSGPAPLGGEPEPLQPLGHTSDKHKLGRGRGWLIWGISRHEEGRFAANFGFKKTSCFFIFFTQFGFKTIILFRRQSAYGPQRYGKRKLSHTKHKSNLKLLSIQDFKEFNQDK